MSDQLVVFTPSPLSNHESKVERITETEFLNPGTYWLCNGTDSEHEDPRYIEGELMLLTNVDADENGFAHRVTLLMPPARQGTSGRKTFNLLVTEFTQHFLFEPNGEAIRKEQVDAETSKLMGLTQSMSEVQSDPAIMVEFLMSSTAPELEETKHEIQSLTALPAPKSGTQLESISSAQNRKTSLIAQAKIADAQIAVLQYKQKQLQSQIGLVGMYHGEIGHLAAANSAGAKKLIEDVNNAIQTLDIYLGNDVVVQQVKSGDSAPVDEKFKVYQDLLYIDEETLINAEMGGARHLHVNQFFKQVAEDDLLLNRILPFKRCLILIRPRRKPYRDDDMSPFEAKIEHEKNQCAFLMIRNGENVHAIFNPMSFLEKLFPSQEDMDASFAKHAGWNDCRTITKEDIEFTDALTSSEKLRRQYKRLVLLLQGVWERDETGAIFGDLDVTENETLLSPQTQNKVFDLIALSETIEHETHLPFKTWRENICSNIRPGSLVYILQDAFTHKTASAAFRYDDFIKNYYQKLYFVDEAFLSKPHSVEKYGSAIGVWADVKEGWLLPADKTSRVFIKIEPFDNSSVINLENVLSSDIEYYFESRRERINYVHNFPMLLELRNIAKRYEDDMAVLVEGFKVTLDKAGQQYKTDELYRALYRYIANNEGQRPSDDLFNNPAESAKLLDEFWKVSGGADNLVKTLKAHFGDDNLMCITSNAKNSFAVYVRNDVHADEYDPNGLPWLVRYKLKDAKSLTFDKPFICRHSEISGKDTILYTASWMKEFVNKQNDYHTITRRQFDNWQKNIEKVFSTESYENKFLMLADKVLGAEVVDDKLAREVLDLFVDLTDEMFLLTKYSESKTGIVPYIRIPIAISHYDHTKTGHKTQVTMFKLSVSTLLRITLTKCKNKAMKGLYESAIKSNSCEYMSNRVVNYRSDDSTYLTTSLNNYSINECVAGIFSENHDDIGGRSAVYVVRNEYAYAQYANYVCSAKCVNRETTLNQLVKFTSTFPNVSKAIQFDAESRTQSKDKITLHDYFVELTTPTELSIVSF